ncbi:MAG: AMP-binding protein [Opitutales bacterium]|nr:AMP-binding protein [Opitutales bacterium]
MNPPSFNVARFLRESAERVPGHCAVRYPQGRNPDGSIRYTELTFAELDRVTAGTADYFKSLGIGAGTRTLLMARPGLDLILCAFALFRLAAVPVAIDPGMGLKSFLRCVQNTAPEALVGIPLAHWIRRVFFKKFSSVKISATVGTRSFSEEIAKRSRSKNCDREIVPAPADRLAAILFTSGSTGAPKGVCYTHGMFDAQREIVRDFYGIRPGEIDLPLLPIFALFNPALGMTTVTPEMNPSKPASLDPEKIVRAIRQNRVTNSFGSPILWRKIAEYCDARGETLPTVRRILCAGTAVPPSLMKLLKKILPNAEIHSPYGATENLPVSDISASDVLSATGTLTEHGRGTCTGTILPQNRVRIIPVCDDVVETFDNVPVLPPGTPGEICVCGPTTTREYFNNVPATRAAKIFDRADGSVWHRMGDVGYIDSEGKLWFLGRKAERVETASGTLFTESCEPIFNTHPDVFRSALIGLGKRGNETPAVVVELRAGTPKKRHPSILGELQKLAESSETARAVKRFFIFPKKFPVDVRHNAKIHRLSLKKHYEK